MIQISSVAQYERNCHTYPMVKGLVDLPGSVAKIGDFMLTASKHKIRLISNQTSRLADTLCIHRAIFERIEQETTAI